MKYKYAYLAIFILAYTLSYILKCCFNLKGYHCFYVVLIDQDLDKLKQILLYPILNMPHIITAAVFYFYVIEKRLNIYISLLLIISIVSIFYWPVAFFIDAELKDLQPGYWTWAISQIYLYGLYVFKYRTFTKKNSAGR